ncbi:hypothetical protein CCACVL1_11050 [Corchorus capsularis]|uniref:Uncharacterized protein n=1 Tax=Corchorus capsularis TaxID=210143 RepID=A0A1R3IN69_COCAP|nr:hypothetical protein CCACVL1_11050 [Corchorus capsularis]
MSCGVNIGGKRRFKEFAAWNRN